MGSQILPRLNAAGSQILPIHHAVGSQILRLFMQWGVESCRVLQRGVNLEVGSQAEKFWKTSYSAYIKTLPAHKFF